MSLLPRTASLWLALAPLAGACSDPMSTPDTVRLRTDSTSITQLSTAPIVPIQVFVENGTSAPVHVVLCNTPAPNIPTAALTLQERSAAGAWVTDPTYTACPNINDAFDQAVAPGGTLRVGRLRPSFHEGTFRYQLVYAVTGTITGTAVSAPFTVTYR